MISQYIIKIGKMLMVGEVKTAKSLLKNLQQTVMVVTKIQKTEPSDSKNINEWYEYIRQ